MLENHETWRVVNLHSLFPWSNVFQFLPWLQRWSTHCVTSALINRMVQKDFWNIVSTWPCLLQVLYSGTIVSSLEIFGDVSRLLVCLQLFKKYKTKIESTKNYYPGKTSRAHFFHHNYLVLFRYVAINIVGCGSVALIDFFMSLVYQFY